MGDVREADGAWHLDHQCSVATKGWQDRTKEDWFLINLRQA
jgi:hypothetical protein